MPTEASGSVPRAWHLPRGPRGVSVAVTTLSPARIPDVVDGHKPSMFSVVRLGGNLLKSISF